jgi:hypothetical protein
MKKTLLTGVLFSFSIALASADGTVQFFNSGISKVKYQEGVDGPIVDAPIGIKIGIFWGTTPSNLALAFPTTTTFLDGVFNGGAAYPLPGTQPGQTVYVKFAGWDGSVGDHWSNSVAYGESEVVLTSPLGTSSGPSPPIWQSATGTSTNRVKPFTILSARQTISQSIDFPELAARTFGDAPFQLNAVASSGLPIVYSSISLSVARIDGSMLTIVGAGSSTIRAFQAGTSEIRPASASRVLLVHKATAMIAATNQARRYDGTAWVPVITTVPPGLPVKVTFFERSFPPAAVGQYTMNVTIESPNYAGSTNVVVAILPGIGASTPGGGTVTIEPPDGAYFADGTARLTATAAAGWTFLQWLGDAATAGSNSISLTMDRNRCVQAVFGTSLSTSVSGSGSVVRNSISARYPYGETVHLTALPDPGSYFVAWSGDASGTNNPLSFRVVTPDPNVAAVFATLPAGSHALTVIPDGFGQVDRSPNLNLLPAGADVVLTAVPQEGQEFLGWTGDASSAENPFVVTASQSRTITARFTKRPRLSIVGCTGLKPDDIQILVTGEFGGRYAVEAKTTLFEPGWEQRGILETPFGIAQFLEAIPSAPNRRVYRAVAE